MTLQNMGLESARGVVNVERGATYPNSISIRRKMLPARIK